MQLFKCNHHSCNFHKYGKSFGNAVNMLMHTRNVNKIYGFCVLVELSVRTVSLFHAFYCSTFIPNRNSSNEFEQEKLNGQQTRHKRMVKLLMRKIGARMLSSCISFQLFEGNVCVSVCVCACNDNAKCRFSVSNDDIKKRTMKKTYNELFRM